jgi:hypothetical protein
LEILIPEGDGTIGKGFKLISVLNITSYIMSSFNKQILNPPGIYIKSINFLVKNKHRYTLINYIVYFSSAKIESNHPSQPLCTDTRTIAPKEHYAV